MNYTRGKLVLQRTRTVNQESVLVTGADGFIGTHLVRALIGLGARVSAICRSAPSKCPGVRSFVGDIRDQGFVERTIAACEPLYVFHLAAWKDRTSSVEAFSDAIQVNLIGTLNLLVAIRKLADSCSVVMAGTADEYGAARSPYNAEEQEQPGNAYGFSKNCATQLGRLMASQYGVPTVTLRPTVAYGPGQPAGMFLTSLIRSLLRDRPFLMTPGEQTRDFIYVDDLVDAFLAAALADLAQGRVYNIGSGNPMKIREVALRVQSILGKEGLVKLGAKEYRAGENMAYSVDLNATLSDLNWRPQTSFDAGLEATIAHCRNEKHDGA